MTAPLSGQFDENRPLATGMFGGPRGIKATRGSYIVQGIGDPAMGYNGYGYYWGQYPAMVGGLSGYQSMSTETGVPLGTPAPQEEQQEKVGGGASSAEIPAYGGTAAF